MVVSGDFIALHVEAVYLERDLNHVGDIECRWDEVGKRGGLASPVHEARGAAEPREDAGVAVEAAMDGQL